MKMEIHCLKKRKKADKKQFLGKEWQK